MSERSSAQSENRILISIFVVALLGHAWLTTRNWTVGFLVGHEFRQTQTALTSYYIDLQNNFSLFYETPLVGKPWVSILLEVPLYEWAVVGLSRATGWSHVVAARTVSLTCFYLMLPGLYLLMGHLKLAPARRLLVLALVLACPLYIFYSRAFLMDSMALMGCVWWLVGFVGMMQKRRWPWFLLATVAGTAAALIKSATYAVWLLPGAAYGAWLLWRELRAGRWLQSLETVFWGVASVAVPLGALRWWILLTDPIKEAHVSAQIFTSGSLAQGNWGLTDLAARVSPKTWGILAERWSEGIMAPWLILALLVVGLLFVPQVRRPVFGLAGVFFLAQLLFPWAYAYQDYYFYTCALFLSAAFGWLFLGALDSRIPRWLCWGLLVVPFAAHLWVYFGNYHKQQMAVSEGGFSYTMALRDFLPKSSVIIVVGADWSAIIPYYSQHRALMVRNGLENDAAYLDRAFAGLADEDVAALVLAGGQLDNLAVVDRAATAFGLDRVPTVTHPAVKIYCSLRYRDRFKQQLAEANNFGDLVNPAVPLLAPELPSKPWRVSQALALTDFPHISPAPLRAYMKFGLGYMTVEKKKVLFAHAPSEVWIRPPGQATRIEWDFGFLAGAYEREGPKTDGAEFVISTYFAGVEREIFKRVLDPLNRPADRGLQQVSISYRPAPGEILRFSTRPGEGGAFDWIYWAKIEAK